MENKENNNYHLTTGKTIADLAIYACHNLNITKSPIVQNVFNKVQKLLKIKGIDDKTTSESLMQNPDRLTILLEAVDRVKIKFDEEIQDLFAKIIADNIENEGSFSLETVHRLAQMSKKDLLFFFNEVAPFCDPANVNNGILYDNRQFLDLNIIFDTRQPEYSISDNAPNICRLKFTNNEYLLIKKDNLQKMSQGSKPLNRFGCELLRLQKIREWTENDKEALMQHCEKASIKREDITFYKL